MALPRIRLIIRMRGTGKGSEQEAASGCMVSITKTRIARRWTPMAAWRCQMRRSCCSQMCSSPWLRRSSLPVRSSGRHRANSKPHDWSFAWRLIPGKTAWQAAISRPTCRCMRMTFNIGKWTRTSGHRIGWVCSRRVSFKA